MIGEFPFSSHLTGMIYITVLLTIAPMEDVAIQGEELDEDVFKFIHNCVEFRPTKSEVDGPLSKH